MARGVDGEWARRHEAERTGRRGRGESARCRAWRSKNVASVGQGGEGLIGRKTGRGRVLVLRLMRRLGGFGKTREIRGNAGLPATNSGSRIDGRCLNRNS